MQLQRISSFAPIDNCREVPTANFVSTTVSISFMYNDAMKTTMNALSDGSIVTVSQLDPKESHLRSDNNMSLMFNAIVLRFLSYYKHII